MLLSPELRQTFSALWVEGDGNCFWRAVSKALWGADEYWRQLKLVVLGWSSVNVEALVGTGGVLHVNAIHYDEAIHMRHTYRGPNGEIDHRRDDYASMLRENIARFCGDRIWGGDLCGILVAEMLGVVVKTAIPTDMLARRRVDAPGGREPTRGSGRKGTTFSDQRLSRSDVPTRGRKNIIVLGGRGDPEIVVEEIAVTVITGLAGHVSGDGTFPDISMIRADTDIRGSLQHYAAIVSKDRHVRRPLPMDQVAPPLFKKFVSDC